MECVRFILDVFVLFSRGVEQWPAHEGVAAATAGTNALQKRLDDGRAPRHLRWLVSEVCEAGRALMGDMACRHAMHVCALRHYECLVAVDCIRALQAAVARLGETVRDQGCYSGHERAAGMEAVVEAWNRIELAATSNSVLWSLGPDLEQLSQELRDEMATWPTAARLYVFTDGVEELRAAVPMWATGAQFRRTVEGLLGAPVLLHHAGEDADVFVVPGAASEAWHAASGHVVEGRVVLCFKVRLRHPWDCARVFDLGVSAREAMAWAAGLDIAAHTRGSWKVLGKYGGEREAYTQSVFESYAAQMQDG